MTRETQPDAESDAALLARFASVRDEVAFAELMRRYGPLVLSVTTRMLRQRQDAEDALQAVFLTLAARARALRRVRSVAGWLHNVAVRVSLNVLKMNRRREQGLRRLEQDHREPPDSEPYELTELLDEELAELPARLKEIVILRDLEGFSRSEVARKLRLPPGTVDSRLSRGRKLLRDRLVRRGVTVGASGLAAAVTHGATAAQALPVALVYETFRHAEIFLLAGSRVVVGTPTVAKITSLAKGELNTMFLSKLSTTVGIVALAAALVLGALPASQLIEPANSLQAAQVFFDDFEDGNATDGTPIAWQTSLGFPGTIFDVSQGNLRISASQGVPTGLVYAPLAQSLTDTTIQALVRLEGAGNDLAGILARATDNQGYIVEIEADGDVYLGIAGIFSQVATDMRPTQEDIVLRLEVVGHALKAWAWRASDPMPSEPLLTGSDAVNPLPAGLPGVYFGANTPAQQTRGTAIFRYVRVEDGTVPEPTSAALGLLGTMTLTSLSFHRRLGRMRR